MPYYSAYKNILMSSQDKNLTPNESLLELPKDLMNSIIQQIELARTKVVSYTNSTLVLLNWQIGNLINQEVLTNKRAE